MKTCSKCKRQLDEDEFNRRGTGLQPWCRDCNKARSKAYYVSNITKHRSVVKINRALYVERNRTWIFSYLKQHPCVDCGASDPVILEFDHLRDKVTNISRLVGYAASIEKIKLEIEKCEVVCANCHRKRSAGRGGYYRVKMDARWPRTIMDED